MKISAFILFIGIFFSFSFNSCQKGGTNSGIDGKVVQLDMKRVMYGSDTAQNMDIYLPANRDTNNTKIVFFIHGGGWNTGDKSDFNEAITSIRNNLSDYAIININYRLAINGKNRFPAQMEDIQLALNFIINNAKEYKINSNKICLVGASAGAHLAMLHAYKNNSSGKIKAVIDLFGPADLVDLYNNHPIPQEARLILINFLGTTPATNAQLYLEASPINYISAQTVPTKIFHGTQDFIVPVSQSNMLKAKLQLYNVKVEMTTYPTEGHGWLGNNLLDTYTKAVQFIKENVQ